MKWFIGIAAILLALHSPAWAGGGVLTVREAAAEKNRLIVTFDHKRQESTDQVHVFVDGVFRKVLVDQNFIAIEDLKPGEHVVELMNATRDYVLKESCLKLEVTISDAGEGRVVEGSCEP